MVRNSLFILFLIFATSSHSQEIISDISQVDTVKFRKYKTLLQFSASADFLDAAINSINSFQSILKKENYRARVISFNNPTSTDLGFSLENEINAALKPLLSKAKNTNPAKFSDIVSSIIQTPSKIPVVKTAIPAINPVFSSLIGLVGTLSVQEKKITRSDLDSFILTTSKYFVQYQKLNQANILFDQNINRLNNRMSELQFDIKEYLLDLITIIYKTVQRAQSRNKNAEELFLQYLERTTLMQKLEPEILFEIIFPADGIKTAKDIAYNLQKLFNEYQKVYAENYQQIRAILMESKAIGKNVNTRQVDASLKELELLYNESKNADSLGLRLKTLFERLKVLVNTEQA